MNRWMNARMDKGMNGRVDEWTGYYNTCHPGRWQRGCCEAEKTLCQTTWRERIQAKTGAGFFKHSVSRACFDLSVSV